MVPAGGIAPIPGGRLFAGCFRSGPEGNPSQERTGLGPLRASSPIDNYRIKLLTHQLSQGTGFYYRLVNKLLRTGDIPSIAVSDRRSDSAQVIVRWTCVGHDPMTKRSWSGSLRKRRRNGRKPLAAQVGPFALARFQQMQHYKAPQPLIIVPLTSHDNGERVQAVVRAAGVVHIRIHDIATFAAWSLPPPVSLGT